jgi:hypothetical protein
VSVASRVAVALAEQVERVAGPRAGLRAWRALARERRDEADIRGQALIEALRCAAKLGDTDAVRELTREWESIQRGVWIASIVAITKTMARKELADEATALAAAESRRHRTARALYLWASCLELEPRRAPIAPDVVARAYRDAAERASNEGAQDIERAARARRLELLSRSWATLPEALSEAKAMELGPLSPAARLAVCRVLLLSPSRFVRAGALGALDDLVATGDEPIARAALQEIARWVDEGGAASSLELDRLAALFGRERAARFAPAARSVIAELGRGDAAPTDPAPGIDRLSVLHEMTSAEMRGERVTFDRLALAERALGAEESSVRSAAVAFWGAWLSRPRPGPPWGYLPLSNALAALGADAAAFEARRAAVARREPLADEMLGGLLAARGWKLAEAGAREEAIQVLREARALLFQSVTASP